MKKNLFRDEALEHLSSPVDTDQLITQPRFSSWIVLIAVFILIGTVFISTFFVTQPVNVPGIGILVRNQSDVQVVFFVNLEQGKSIDPGMTVRIFPMSSNRERNEFIYGEVISVNSFPVTRQQIIAELGSPELADTILTDPSAGKAPFEVRATLLQDPGSPGKYLWSAPVRYPVKIEPGTPVWTSVTIRKVTISSLLFGV